MNNILHNSRDAFYRFPSGAREAGSRIMLRLRVNDANARAWLRLWWVDTEQKIPMTRRGDAFEAALDLPGEPGLLWYYFIVELEDGTTTLYGNAHDQLGGEGAIWPGEPPSFQITLYAPGFQTPEWMQNGVMYQIMPDRFHRAQSEPPLNSRIHPHWIHPDWSEAPELIIDPETADNSAADFFGGNLRGIAEKLPYLADLGVSALYLNPIFEARSNHKYDTGDYAKVDPAFGDEADFTELCAKAKALGIRVILDGVFSHTGSDSVYFNKYGSYDSIGAYQSKDSPYYGWYRFERWPDEYDSWWGFHRLPNVNELHPTFFDFIVRAPGAVAARWLRAGASGWRLDVADEQPMPFLAALRERVKREDDQAAVIGEVWEDASNKVAYGELRNYCLGDTLDGVMNYPLRDGLLRFMTGSMGARELARRLSSLYENYPEPFARGLLNLLGSHDKPRAINVLAGVEVMQVPRGSRRAYRLSEAQYDLGRRRLIAAWRFLCALPGMPCLYYGDEAGAQGGDDPFCRGTYPWGTEDEKLIGEFQQINRARRNSDALKDGQLRLIAPQDDLIIAARWNGRECALCALNWSEGVLQLRVKPEDIPELALDREMIAAIPPQSSVFYRWDSRKDSQVRSDLT